MSIVPPFDPPAAWWGPAPDPRTTIPRFAGRLIPTSATKAGRPVGRSRDHIASSPFFTPQPSAHFFWVVPVDIDSSDAVAAVMWAIAVGRVPVPSWVVESPSGHAQVGWIIEGMSPGGARGDGAPGRLFLDLWAALTGELEGDFAFSRHRMRNPWYSGARVWWGRTEARSMTALMREMQVAGSWRPGRPADEWGPRIQRVPPADEILREGARAVGVFDRVRHIAYARARAGTYSAAALWEAAAAVPCDPSLPAAELRSVVRSVDRFMRSRWGAGAARGAAPSWVVERARRGGRCGSRAQHEQRVAALVGGRAAASASRRAAAAERDEAIVALHIAEPELRQWELGKRLGESRTRVQRALRVYRLARAAAADAAPDGEHAASADVAVDDGACPGVKAAEVGAPTSHRCRTVRRRAGGVRHWGTPLRSSRLRAAPCAKYVYSESRARAPCL